MTPDGANGREPKPLTDDEVLAIVDAEIRDALLDDSSEIAANRARAIDYYHGRPFGNEVEGRSSVVLTDVADTIEWIMPSLMRMFTGGDTVAEYEPQSEEDVEAAKQATEALNIVFMREHDGFRLLMDWFKTALLESDGTAACEYVEKIDRQTSIYRGLSEEEMVLLVEDENIELVSAEVHPQQIKNPETGQMDTIETYDLRVTDKGPRGMIECRAIAPEHMLVARRARDIQSARFCGERRKMTLSDLLALGYDEDLIADLPADDSPEFDEAAIKRHSDGEMPDSTASRADWGAREVWITKCYIRIDEDGDGFTELRRIVVAGDTGAMVILDDEEVNENPYSHLTPIPFPHRYHGIGIADVVADLQLIRSTVLRNLLDNIYLTNNSRTVVVEGQVEVEDLLTSRPGGIIRAQSLEAVAPLEVGRLDRWAFDMLELLAGAKEERTGVTRYNQGLDASSLNKTATGITSLLNAANSRIELIARIFAETGLKTFFRKLLHLYVETPQKPKTIRLRNEWVTVDPSRWNREMDLSIRVGLGIGQAAERMGNLLKIAEIQQSVIAQGGMGYLVTPQNIYNTAAELTQTMGYKAVGMFFENPAGKPPPEPPPDPKMIEAQNKAQQAQGEMQLKQVEMQDGTMQWQAELEFKYKELDQKTEIEMQKIASQERVAMQKAEQDAKLRREEMRMKASEGPKKKTVKRDATGRIASVEG